MHVCYQVQDDSNIYIDMAYLLTLFNEILVANKEWTWGLASLGGTFSFMG